MLCFKDYYFLYEEITKEQITPYETVLNGVKVSGNIIRNAGASARENIYKESEEILGKDVSGEIGFLIYAPTKNVYFFNRDLISHDGAARRLGIDIVRYRVFESLCGYYRLHDKIGNRIYLSDFSTNKKWFVENNIDPKELATEAFKKALVMVDPLELENIEKDFRYVTV